MGGNEETHGARTPFVTFFLVFALYNQCLAAENQPRDAFSDGH